MPPARPAVERVLAHCERSPDGCLLWTGYVDPITGYARVNVRKPGGGWRQEYAHRVVYEHHHGPIPEGHEVDHVRKRGCTHRHCQDWTHLEAVTPAENLRRGDVAAKTAAAHATQTHCRRAGHEFTPENTYFKPNGKYRNRVCRACKNERERERKRRLRRTSPGSL